MRVKRFEAANLQAAWEAVRRELGSDAVILQTRKIKTGGVFGFFGRERIEILAAMDAGGRLPRGEAPPEKPPRRDKLPRPKPRPQQAPRPDPGRPAPKRAAGPAEPDSALDGLKAELQEMKSAIRGMARRSGDEVEPFPDPFGELYLLLLENEVEDCQAQEIIHNLHMQFPRAEEYELRTLKAALKGQISRMVKIAPIPEQESADGGPVCIAFVGPTGVGKTTTIAKIASDLVIAQGRRVGLVSADTYRIAAVEQLRTYADIIQIPLDIVYGPENVQEVLGRLGDMDMLLIDTAGRSPRNSDRISELGELLAAFRPAATHLVMAASTKRSDLLSVARSFAPARYDDLIFTKVDETLHFGGLLSVIEHTGKGVAYMTTGQNVPEDIEQADARHIAGLILGGKGGAEKQ